jgi:hypothetical protein
MAAILMASPLSQAAGIISTTNIKAIGYTDQYLQSELDYLGPYGFQSGPYAFTAKANYSLAWITIDLPYKKAGSLCYFNVQLADGTIKKGSYQYTGDNDYTLVFDGSTYEGHYNYSLTHGLSQGLADLINGALGRDGGRDRIIINYAKNLSDRTKFGLYVRAYGGDSEAQGLILSPLSSPTQLMKGCNLISNVDGSVQVAMANQSSFLAAITNNDYDNYFGPLAPYIPGGAEEGNPGAFDNYIKVIGDFVSLIVSFGTAALQVLLLIIMIGSFMLDPLNLVMILMQVMGLTAIMALSGKGDILDCGERWARQMAAFFRFIVAMTEQILNVLGVVVQALSQAIQTGTQIAQAGAQTLTGIVQWLLILVK